MDLDERPGVFATPRAGEAVQKERRRDSVRAISKHLRGTLAMQRVRTGGVFWTDLTDV
jgi:hypothetical protein